MSANGGKQTRVQACIVNCTAGLTCVRGNGGRQQYLVVLVLDTVGVNVTVKLVVAVQDVLGVDDMLLDTDPVAEGDPLTDGDAPNDRELVGDGVTLPVPDDVGVTL